MVSSNLDQVWPDAINGGEDQDAVDCPSPCKSAGRPRAVDKEARLQDLLDTAARLFLEKGYGKVSLEMIAREAHVAVRTIYVKFGGKEGLFQAVISNGRARYFGNMDDLDTDARPMQEILGDFGRRILELLTMSSVCKLHRIVIAEAGNNRELADTFYQAGPGKSRELLKRYFSRPDVRPLFRAELEVTTLVTHLLNCLIGDQVHRLVYDLPAPPTEPELKARVALGLDLFFRATLRQP